MNSVSLGNSRAKSKNTDNFSPVTMLVGIGNVMISAGYQHSAVLRSDGSVWTTGNNDRGQLGIFNATGRRTPGPMDGVGTGNTAVATGYEHTLVIRGDGSVWTSGSSGAGQLGEGAGGIRVDPPLATTVSGMAPKSGWFGWSCTALSPISGSYTISCNRRTLTARVTVYFGPQVDTAERAVPTYEYRSDDRP